MLKGAMTVARRVTGRRPRADSCSGVRRARWANMLAVLMVGDQDMLVMRANAAAAVVDVGQRARAPPSPAGPARLDHVSTSSSTSEFASTFSYAPSCISTPVTGRHNVHLLMLPVAREQA